MLYVIPPYFIGDTDKQYTEDEKESESHTVLLLDEKKTDYKDV